MITRTSPASALAAVARASGDGPLKDAAFQSVRTLVLPQVKQGAEGLGETVKAAWAEADLLWAATRSTPAFALGTEKSACGKGCGWCCHQRVGAAAVEVLAIARELETDSRYGALGGRLDAWQGGRICPFLEDGACVIYSLRPMKCRGVYHLDARWCMTTYAKMDLPLAAQGTSPDHRSQSEPKDIYEGALLGLALPFHHAGLDCPGLDFIPALKAVLHRPKAIEDWWRGREIFPAESRLHTWFPGKPPAGKSGGHRRSQSSKGRPT